MADERCKETVCCPKFDPQPWDGKEIAWQEKRFLKDKVRCIFHIPLNFPSVMMKNMAKIERAGAKAEPTIVLSDECSAWRKDVMIEVSKDVPDAEMTSISGTMLSKVYEGPYRMMGAWMKDMVQYASAKGKEAKKLLVYYTTCPKCAKKYGKNYVVLLARV